MAWIEFGLIVNKDYVELVEDKLLELGALSISLTDAEDEEIFEPGDEIFLWDKILIKGLYDDDKSALVDEFKEWAKKNLVADADLVFFSKRILDTDWLAASKASFPPIKLADNFWIIPKWQKVVDASATNLLINPGLAFGTGTHSTTSLCLQWLLGQNLAEKSVLDYGSGSGILAIAALMLGAKSALATDIDQLALDATYENAQLNSVDSKLKILPPKDILSPKVDFLLANILAKPLINLAPLLASYLKKEAKICLSGILAWQADDVMNAYQSWISWQEPSVAEEWVCLTGVLK